MENADLFLERGPENSKHVVHVHDTTLESLDIIRKYPLRQSKTLLRASNCGVAAVAHAWLQLAGVSYLVV